MDADRQYDRTTYLHDAENWLALGGGAPLLLVGTSRRSVAVILNPRDAIIKVTTCIKVVMKPGVGTPHHINPLSSRQQ